MGQRKCLNETVTFIILFNTCINMCYSATYDGNVLTQISWWEINKYFMDIANNGLFTRDVQRKLDTEFEWTEKEVDLMQILSKRQKYFDVVFFQRIQGVRKLRDTIVDNFDDFQVSEPTAHCCERQKDNTNDLGCFHGKDLKKSLGANPPPKVLAQMSDISTVYSFVTNLYFSLSDGTMYTYPTPGGLIDDIEKCSSYDPHSRPWYEMAQSPVPRDVFVLLDYSHPETNSESTKIKRKIASDVIRSLTQQDRIFLVDNRNSYERKKQGRHVDFGVWLVGTIRNRNKLVALIANSKEKEEFMSHSERVQAAKEAFNSPMKLAINITRKADKVFVQIVSDEKIASLNESYWHAGWLEHGRTMPTTITYLIANNTADNSCQTPTSKQNIVTISSAEEYLACKEKKFLSFFKWTTYLKRKDISPDPENDVKITLPYIDYYDNDITLTLTLPIVINGTYEGTAACDISALIDLEYVAELAGIQDSYSFLVDQEGRALSHPLLPSPYCTATRTNCKDPTFELVNHLEQDEQVLDILQSMVDMNNGSKVIDGIYVQSTGHVLNDEQGNPVRAVTRRLAYAWVPLTNVKLSLAIVIPVHSDMIFNVTYNCLHTDKCENAKYIYHEKPREYTTENLQNCSYFGADVIKNVGLLKFSPMVFKNPLKYLKDRNGDPILQALKQGKPFSSFLRGMNRNASIAIANTAVNIWKRERTLDCYIGIRYLGTSDGVFMSYPGITLKKRYDHLRRPWYHVAADNRKPYQKTVSITVPYQDYFSGGEVITVATPLEKTLPSGYSFLAGVIGGDFSTRFLIHNLRERLPECSGNVTCFLIDTMGFIVLHFKDSNMHKLHITQAYQSVAADLLKSDILVRKACHDYEKDAVFQYWFFEMPEQSTSYCSGKTEEEFQIYEIPYMNVFLVALKRAKDVRRVIDTNSSDCKSTCSNRLEPPCKVTSPADCREEDLRMNFDHSPACFPSTESPTDDFKNKPCAISNSNTCFGSNTEAGEEDCKLWEPNCVSQRS